MDVGRLRWLLFALCLFYVIAARGAAAAALTC
jgi:hypothetical protein